MKPLESGDLFMVNTSCLREITLEMLMDIE